MQSELESNENIIFSNKNSHNFENSTTVNKENFVEIYS